MKKLKDLFIDKKLFNLALTHRSWVNENKNVRRSNERLEFLGDAVLEFVVSSELYKKFKNKEEGYMTTLRARLVNTQNLASVASKLGLGKLIYLSKGEEEGGGRSNPSLLADTVEAVIGAMFVDQGIKVAEEFIREYILSDIPKLVSKPLKDAKSRLQELLQSRGLSAPSYKVVSQIGPDHNKKYVVEVASNGKSLAKGSGKSKSVAEQKAAEVALDVVE